MILYRCFAWNERERPSDQDGPLWFPRVFQGDGRHDNPDRYACLYVSERALSCAVEQFARFRGQPWSPSWLRRRGLPLAIASLELDDTAVVVDLDDPVVLRRERIRPSRVATRNRDVTRPQARAFHERHPGAAGLRWWSTYEALWANVTLFDRAAPLLRVQAVQRLSEHSEILSDALEHLGIPMTG